jgi:hypothetical protein
MCPDFNARDGLIRHEDADSSKATPAPTHVLGLHVVDVLFSVNENDRAAVGLQQRAVAVGRVTYAEAILAFVLGRMVDAVCALILARAGGHAHHGHDHAQPYAHDHLKPLKQTTVAVHRCRPATASPA